MDPNADTRKHLNLKIDLQVSEELQTRKQIQQGAGRKSIVHINKARCRTNIQKNTKHKESLKHWTWYEDKLTLIQGNTKTKWISEDRI